MSKEKIYVGNLSFNSDEDVIRDYFSEFGEIADIRLIKDRETQRSKGFAFITFGSDEAGENALQADGKELDGRRLKVNTARDDRERGGDRGGRF